MFFKDCILLCLRGYHEGGCYGDKVSLLVQRVVVVYSPLSSLSCFGALLNPILGFLVLPRIAFGVVFRWEIYEVGGFK